MNDKDEFPGDLQPLHTEAKESLDNLNEADIGRFEELFKAAGDRAARNGIPREEFDPLLRLVRSYLKGSYRDAPLGDVAWALAAISLVARGVADPRRILRIPRFRLDRRTIKWVNKHIAGTLAAYEAWEQAIGEGAPSATLRTASAPITSLDVRVLDPMSPTLFGDVAPEGRKPTGTPVAAGPLLDGANAVRRTLEAGDVVRVLGPPEVLEGLRKRTLELIKSGSGNLGVVRDTNKDFAGHLRFGEVEFAGVAAPTLAAFQVASAITLQYYLARIDRQLTQISQELEASRGDTQDDRYGRIETAREKCASVERVLTITSSVGQSDALRLELAVYDLEQTYQALRSNAEKFCSRVEAVDLAIVDKNDLERLLETAASSQLTDT